MQIQEGGLAAQASIAARGLSEDLKAQASTDAPDAQAANGAADAACQITDLTARLDKSGAELAQEKSEHAHTRRCASPP